MKARQTTEPDDRLSRIADAALDAAKDHPEHRPGDQVVVLIDNAEAGTVGVHGYDPNMSDLTINLLMHVRAILQLQGKEMQVHAIGAPHEN